MYELSACGKSVLSLVLVSTTESFGFVTQKVFLNSDRQKGCVN